MSISDLPSVNATLNFISAILLTLGYVSIKRGNPRLHIRFMVAALSVSALFLISYVVYHYAAGSRPYPHYDWSRYVYFAILIPHVLLAAVQVPFIIIAVWHGYRGNYPKHTRITRWLWPVWMFVSVSGVIVYIMLYRL